MPNGCTVQPTVLGPMAGAGPEFQTTMPMMAAVSAAAPVPTVRPRAMLRWVFSADSLVHR